MFPVASASQFNLTELWSWPLYRDGLARKSPLRTHSHPSISELTLRAEHSVSVLYERANELVQNCVIERSLHALSVHIQVTR